MSTFLLNFPHILVGRRESKKILLCLASRADEPQAVYLANGATVLWISLFIQRPYIAFYHFWFIYIWTLEMVVYSKMDHSGYLLSTICLKCETKWTLKISSRKRISAEGKFNTFTKFTTAMKSISNITIRVTDGITGPLAPNWKIRLDVSDA